MEMKYVVPDMAQSFGTLEFAGESEWCGIKKVDSLFSRIS